MSTMAKHTRHLYKNGENIATTRKKEALAYLLSEDTLELIACWSRDNFTQMEIAEKLDLPFSTFRKYYVDNPELREACSKGKELIDYRVENALLKSALGYKAKECKITTIIKGGKVIETTKEVLTKDVSPSVPAIQMWLHNRKPDTWKKNRDGFGIDIAEEDQTVQINVIRANPQAINENVANGDTAFEDETDVINESVQFTQKKLSEKEIAKKKKEKQKKQLGRPKLGRK